jgi:hypothetical protein
MGGGGSALLSEVRRESGGDIRPDMECPVGPAQPDEYGGGPLEYIEEGLTTAVAIVGAEVYVGRSLEMWSLFSRLMMDGMPLVYTIRSGRRDEGIRAGRTFACYSHPLHP